jgi:hypothetical protein
MPILPCPQCQNPTARMLDFPSKGAMVWYYRCQNCAHVWTIDKKDPTAMTHVTALREPPEPQKK